MKNIQNDIAAHTFKKVYLLCGSETYLVNRYRDMLKNAVTEGQDPGSLTMNYATYDGNKGFDIKDLSESINSFPFFADHRLVVVSDSGLFGSEGADFAEDLDDMPDSTVLIFVEQSPDKRTKLYKAIQKCGYICEFSTPSPEETARMIGAHFAGYGKKASSATIDYFIDYVGGDLFHLVNEADKLCSYAGDRPQITEADINAICTMQIEKKIFEIIDNLMNHDLRGAMNIYFDLVALKESPLGILRVIMSQYNSLLLVRDGMDRNMSDAEIASSGKLSPWLVKKNRGKLRNCSRKQLLASLVACLNTEEDIKTGNLAESTGIEILLANLAAM